MSAVLWDAATTKRSSLAVSTQSRLRGFMSARAIQGTLKVLSRRLEAVAACADTEDTKKARKSHARRLKCQQSIGSTVINNWRNFIDDFGLHVESFARTMRPAFPAGRVADVRFDLSEPHFGGRTVVRLEFENSNVWYYKPRSGKKELLWGCLLRVLSATGFSPPLVAAPVLLKGSHCWMREISHLPCQDWHEVERFYIRAGALLCLAHTLRAVDLHAGNFIAHGEHPVLIDAETLMHPNVRIPPNAPDKAETLSRTGMLRVGRPESQRDCVSFLGRVTTGTHTVFLGTRKVSAKDAIEPLTTGFRAMNECLKKAWTRPELRTCIRKLGSFPVRTIYRPTVFYAKLLNESLSSEYIASQEARRYFLQARLNSDLVSPATVQEEINQLVNCDIPLFYGPSATIRCPLSRSDITRSVRIVRESCGV